MPKILQLSTHVANLIAAGEVVERPASVVKELLENAVDAGASKITVEIKDGGMTFLRVTDDGCGMSPEDARTAFLRHATSKLRTEEDLAAIGTMGFRGEALAAIASVSRIDLMTKTAGAVFGTSLHLEAGVVTEESEAGCPEGTTIIIRDLFFNTPARMKFMKSDSVEGGKVANAVQMQALAHADVSVRLIRDGKEVMATPGNGGLQAAVYCIYGREFARMIPVSSRWENCTLSGYVSKPTDARPSRHMQTFFVNGRPVKSKLLMTALEEAYRNQLMVGKFPACVLHLTLPANAVDVNVHPAKTEVKFLSEKTVFDCLHYGVLGALNKTPDRPEIRFRNAPEEPARQMPEKPARSGQENFFRTMNTEEYRAFSKAMENPPRPDFRAAAATAEKVEKAERQILREPVRTPECASVQIPPMIFAMPAEIPEQKPKAEPVQPAVPAEPASIPFPLPPEPADMTAEAEQSELPMPESAPELVQEEIPMEEKPSWRMVGELYRTYILVEQGEEAFLIDKHAAHERILFDKLKENPEKISSQMLMVPVPCSVTPECAGELLGNRQLLDELGFEVEEFGENTLLIRRIPMDLTPESASEALDAIAADLLNGRREKREDVRDELLHTVACKAAIKAGWVTDDQELLALVRQVMKREDLKYCPHGRPICVTLSKRQLEKQFKRIV